MMKSKFGVYLHIPFCARRCDYCAFATWDDKSSLIEQYCSALLTAIKNEQERGMPRADSVFFGGGTPSLIPPKNLVQVLQALDCHTGAEITVECNPDTVSIEHFEIYKSHGVNRISLGVQSMIPSVLKSLGRTHSPKNVTSAVLQAKSAGIENINIDLIYGAAGETISDWEQTLHDVLSLEPTHISAYALTVESGTPLAKEPNRFPDDDDQAEKYEIADELLASFGYQWYEISNWAKPGFECFHNQLYWDQSDYLGIGCAAHSYRSQRRFWSIRTPERWINEILQGNQAVAGEEKLDKTDREIEGLQLQLRTRDGVPKEALQDVADIEGDLIQDHPTSSDRWILTRKGRMLANVVALRLVTMQPS